MRLIYYKINAAHTCRKNIFYIDKYYFSMVLSIYTTDFTRKLIMLVKYYQLLNINEDTEFNCFQKSP